MRWMVTGCALAVLVVLAGPAAAQEAAPLSRELRNPGFEQPSISAGAEAGATPDGWFFFSSHPEKKIGLTDARRRGGLQSLKFTCPSETNQYAGIAQHFAAAPGCHYTFSAYVLGDALDIVSGGAYGQISLEWQDAEGKEITRIHGPVWDAAVSPDRWHRFVVEAAVPKGAVRGAAVITFFSGESMGQGTFYVDDANLTWRRVQP